MRPVETRVIEVIEESESTKTFILDTPWMIDPIPGQYLMVWIRGVDEIPMSLSANNSITVQRVGDATSALLEYKAGDSIGLRGAYGNGFDIKGRSIAIIAGGMGAAPLVFLAERARDEGIEVTTILGAKNKSEILFLNRFDSTGEVMISTDDGSLGHAGYVTDLLEDLPLLCYDQIYTCGPEAMMLRILKICEEMKIESRLQLSIQRYIKCGMGICGSCCIDSGGLRACKEGPVFTGDQLTGGEFGVYRRDASGRREKIR
ncbi:MAG: dihydroorotate dehydrogenase electron transfer subunit [Halobacteriota archaeon]|nr:dihydroorotate dehydrogenase electron transfer subunit [Halobacteriota archaeon]